MSAATGGRWLRRLRTRLFLSYAVVVATGTLTMLVVGTLVTRTVYGRRLGGVGIGGPVRGGAGGAQAEPVSEAQMRTLLDDSLVPALLAGAAAALVAAAAVAWFVGLRLLRPLDQVRDATQQMAAGDFDVRVPIPVEVELASLAEDVNDLGAHLSTIEQRRTELLGELAHELRTPITLIRGRMEGVIDGVVEPTDQLFVGIAEEAARMQRLVDDLSVLSRADENVLEIRAVPVDLVELVLTITERLRPQFEHGEVRLDVDHPPTQVIVLGDSDRLTQVVTNLLGNALGHTPAGGTVTVRAGRSREEGWVEVHDTGSGIPVEELERIFDRFHRLPDPEAARRPGRGLGLTIARSIARAHGGDVTAASQGRGTGAMFRLTVPLAPT